jgi:hypothetical protein
MKGHCLCGSIKIETPNNQNMSACHCGMCRRWGGGPMMSIHCGSDVSVEGADKIKTFQSSAWAERAFCSQCGTHLYYRLIPTNEYILSIGLFQDGPEFQFREQIFIDRKPSNYEFANATATLTEAEIFAKFAPPSS